MTRNPFEATEDMAFDILMESVLKMSNVMKVSIFLLVESRGKRRYGGCDDLCSSFKSGTMKATNGDVHLSLCGNGETTVVDSVGVVDAVDPVDAADLGAADVVETEEIVSDPDEVSKEKRDQSKDLSDQTSEPASSDSDWLAGKDHVRRRRRSKRRSADTKLKIEPIAVTAAADLTMPLEFAVAPPLDERDEMLVKEILDYAEGRANYEDSWDAGVADMIQGNAVAIYEAAEVSPDEGAKAGSSEDDEWKPVNYGKGKLYSRQRKKTIKKEMRRLERRSAPQPEGDDDLHSSLIPRVTPKKPEAGNCPQCGLYFNKLRQHVTEVHGTERRFSCECCAMRFKRDEHLKKHLRCVHKIT